MGSARLAQLDRCHVTPQGQSFALFSIALGALIGRRSCRFGVDGCDVANCAVQIPSRRGMENREPVPRLLAQFLDPARGLMRSTHNMWNGPRCKDAFQSISPHDGGAVICPAFLRGT